MPWSTKKITGGKNEKKQKKHNMIAIRGIGGGWRGVANPPKTQKSQKATPPETPLKSSGIATTLKPNSNPPKNFRDRPPYA